VDHEATKKKNDVDFRMKNQKWNLKLQHILMVVSFSPVRFFHEEIYNRPLPVPTTEILW
jgi:hypothetical protein